MVMFTMENGRTIKHKVLVFIYIIMVQNMKVIGIRITRMGMAFNHGLMEASMKAIIDKEKNMDTVNIYGKMVEFMKENGTKANSTG